MKILIIGGTGFISSSLTKQLLQNDHHVTLFNRGKSSNKISDHRLKYVTGNRDNISDLQKTLIDGNYDVVIDMIAYSEEDSKKAIEVFKGRTARFIHCSTISVYMVSDDVSIPITEDQDKKPLMKYFKKNPFGMDYGINKRRCEDILWNEHSDKFPVTMLRPTYVSGPQDPAARDYFWIERIMDGNPLLVPGNGNYLFQQVYVEDVANAFVKAVENDNSIGQAYNVADEVSLTLNNYLKVLFEIIGKHPEVVHFPQSDFDLLNISHSTQGDVFPFNTRRDAVFSLDKIKAELGYRSTPYKEWLNRTIEFYKNYSGYSAGYEKRSEELKLIQKIKQAI